MPIHPSFCPPSTIFLKFYHYFFLNFGLVPETHMKLCMTELDFSEKIFALQKLENCPKMDPKQVFLNLLKNVGINFYWICSRMKFYSICCVPVQIPYLKNFSPETCAKMISANQIVGFFNKPYIQNKSLKWLDFLHVDTNSYELKVNQKFLVWAGSKMGLAS